MKKHRAGFTLVELLVVIMLIGVMASFILVALVGASASAKDDRTRAQIMKIHELIMEQWEEYQYRRIPPTQWMQEEMFQTNIKRLQSNQERTEGFSTKRLAFERLRATRDLMRLEFPSLASDVASPARFIVNFSVTAKYQPAKLRAYRRRAQLAMSQTGIDWLDLSNNSTENAKIAANYQDAECLYLILSQLRDADSSALDFFNENEIGDIDGDGMKEIHDAWGKPIRWALWAPAYRSPLQVPLSQKVEQHDLLDTSLAGSGYNSANFDNTVTLNSQGDPSLAVNLGDMPRTLYPLILSMGPDGKAGVVLQTAPTSSSGEQSPQVYQSWFAAGNDPYNRDPALEMFLIGATSASNPGAGEDDISNHYLTTTR